MLVHLEFLFENLIRMICQVFVGAVGLRGHCIITSRLRVGGFFENVMKRDGGGWVG